MNIDKEVVYAQVDDINVYKFISQLHKSCRYLWKFDKFEDIKKHLKEQSAGLMGDYLNGLKEKKELDNIANQISKLETISRKMELTINAMSKNIINDDEDKEELMSNMVSVDMDNLARHLIDSIFVRNHRVLLDSEINTFIDNLLNHIIDGNFKSSSNPQDVIYKINNYLDTIDYSTINYLTNQESCLLLKLCKNTEFRNLLKHYINENIMPF